MEYCSLESYINNLVSDVVSAEKRFQAGVQSITQANNLLAALSSNYLDAINTIDAKALEDPADIGWKALKARMDKAIEHGITLKTTVNAAVSALE